MVWVSTTFELIECEWANYFYLQKKKTILLFGPHGQAPTSRFLLIVAFFLWKFRHPYVCFTYFFFSEKFLYVQLQLPHKNWCGNFVCCLLIVLANCAIVLQLHNWHFLNLMKWSILWIHHPYGYTLRTKIEQFQWNCPIFIRL